MEREREKEKVIRVHNWLEVVKSKKRERKREGLEVRPLMVAGRPVSPPFCEIPSKFIIEHLRCSLTSSSKSFYFFFILVINSQEGKTEEETKEYRFSLHSQFSYERWIYMLRNGS